MYVLYPTSFIDLNLEIYDPNDLPALLLKSFILILRSMFSLKIKPRYLYSETMSSLFRPSLKLNVVLFTSFFLKWTIFDLPALIRMCHFWHQELTQLSNSCKSASLSAINTKSSVYRRWDNIISGPICTPTLGVFSSFDKSFLNIY